MQRRGAYNGTFTIKIENMQLIFTAKYLHNLKSTLEEYGLLDQPITTHPMQLIT